MTISIDRYRAYRAQAHMPATILAADVDEAGAGRVKALVSAYDVKYRIGFDLWHTIEQGAAKATIERHAGRVPGFWMHSWSSSEQPPIGHSTGITETDDGLVIDAELYLEDSETARAVYRAMKAEALTEFSIGYEVLAARVDEDDDAHEYVTELELLEWSSVLRGANPATETLEVAASVEELPPPAPPAEATSPEPDPGPAEEGPEPDVRKPAPAADYSQRWVRDLHHRSR